MSLSVVQLCSRIGRRSKTGDFTRMSMIAQEDVLAAANGAIQRLYNALPAYFKEQTQGFVLPAPIIGQVIGVTQFSKDVTGITFGDDQFGRNIIIDGDSAWNQIIGEDKLLNPYMGPTGSASTTIYGNAVFSTDYPFDRVIGNPTFANANQTPFLQTDMARIETPDVSWFFQKSVGMPRAWWTQVFGESQGVSPMVVLRFAPAPDKDYAINVRLAFWPKLLTIADIAANSPVYVPDQFIYPSLIPMAIQEFMQSPEWLSRKDEQQVQAAGNAGEAWARAQLGQIASPRNKVYTPIGY